MILRLSIAHAVPLVLALVLAGACSEPRPDGGEAAAADASSDVSGDRSADGTLKLPGPPPDIFEESAEGGDAASREGLRTMPVTIYQRAERERLSLTYVDASIVWFDSPVERARQLVRHVLDGVPGTVGLPPGPAGATYKEVYLDDRGVMWVDIPGRLAGTMDGSDQEQALVACLAMTLTRNLEEVRGVGILVDGEPRTTLSGHVDLTRVYTGLEWRRAIVLPTEVDGVGAPQGASL